MLLIKAVPGCLVNSNVPTCDANTMVLLRFAQIVVRCVSHGVVFEEVSCWVIEAVGAHALCSPQVVDWIDEDVNCIFVRFVGIRLCCP